VTACRWLVALGLILAAEIQTHSFAKPGVGLVQFGRYAGCCTQGVWLVCLRFIKFASDAVRMPGLLCVGLCHCICICRISRQSPYRRAALCVLSVCCTWRWTLHQLQ
jgi:hypothetical protein